MKEVRLVVNASYLDWPFWRGHVSFCNISSPLYEAMMNIHTHVCVV
jgi:hypothetical protein